MVDDTTKPARSYNTNPDNSGREIDEDPLVELARIVSEDGSFFQDSPARPVNPPISKTRPDAFTADLEAELMEEFEASIARQSSGAIDIAGAEVPAPEVDSEIEHADYLASDSQALGAMAADAQSEDRGTAEYEGTGVYGATTAQDRPAPYDPPADPLTALPGNPANEPAIEPIADPYRVAPDDTTTGAAIGEPHPDAIEPNAIEPNAIEMEFADALADTASPPLKEDFTPEFGVEAYAHEPEFQDSQASGDGPIADASDDPANYYGGAAAGDEADDADKGAMPPPVAARAGGRKGLIAVAGVLAVVVLGGGIAAYISKSAPKDPAMPVPVIKAETGAVKVMADATDTAAATPSLLDQLAGQQTKSEEKLIDRIEEPQQIARVVLPDPVGDNLTQLAKPVGEPVEEPSGSVSDAIAKTIDRVMQEPQQPTVAPRFDPIGPRRVRTVVVKSDGTFISNDDAVAPAQATLPALPSLPPLETMKVASVEPTQSPEPTPVKTMDILSIPALGESVAISGSSDAADGQDPPTLPTPPAVANTEKLAPVMDAMNGGDAGDAMLAMAVPTGAIPRSKPANVPDAVVAVPAGQATPSAGRSTRQPVNLLAAPAKTDRPRVTASTAPTATVPETSGYVVQVSAQRSADQAQASFANMKRRYKSVLGGFDPDIQRADLGDRGIYYRVRIGPMASREAALRLCEQLKSAGGNCFVTR